MGYITETQANVFSILHLCTMVGFPISRSLLVAAGQPRNAWVSDGSMTQFSILELGLHADVVAVLNDANSVDGHVRLFKALGLVEECLSEGSNELNIVSRVDLTTQAKPSDWNRVMILACFFFTGCCEYISK